MVSDEVGESHYSGEPDDGEDSISVFLCFSFQCVTIQSVSILAYYSSALHRQFDVDVYEYDIDGIIMKVKVYKKGKYHSDGQF